MADDRTRINACLDEISRLQDELRIANATLAIITNAVTADMEVRMDERFPFWRATFLHE